MFDDKEEVQFEILFDRMIKTLCKQCNLEVHQAWRITAGKVTWLFCGMTCAVKWNRLNPQSVPTRLLPPGQP